MQSLLSPLSGICLNKLTDEARREVYGDDYNKFSETDKDDWVRHLDETSHVPNNAEKMIQLEGYVRRSCHFWVNCAWEKMDNTPLEF